MNESIRLGTVRGIRVGMHWSLLLILWLLVAGLAGYQFPNAAPGHTGAAYWAAAVVAAVAFYASLLAHELAHAVIARRRHIEVEGIVLWLLGGMSKLRGEARTASDEERIAIAGPATSIALAAMFFLLSRVVGAGHPASLPAAVLGWLGWLNGILAAFNLIPAFPLDGGRVLRALLWRRTGDKRRATSVAATWGRIVGFGFIALGVAGFALGGAGVNGVWLALIGWFLISASRAEAMASAPAAAPAHVEAADVPETHITGRAP
ncbi:MAG: site-2 protease family protein [Acidimicrobiia bacterium]|nr:site-2 protease family protein [Acidimicrobiia bacterium]